MKPTIKAPPQVCYACEAGGRPGAVCEHCGVAYPVFRFTDEDRAQGARPFHTPAPPDEYSAADRAAFRHLDQLTAMEGGR